MNNQGQQGAESFNQVQNDVQSQVVNPQDVNQQQYDAQQQYYQQYNQQQYDAQQQYYQQQYDMQQQYYQQQYEMQQQYDGQQYAQQNEAQNGSQQSYDEQQRYAQHNDVQNGVQNQAYQQNYQQPVPEDNAYDGGNGGKNNSGKKKTGLIIGIIAAVLVVAAVIVAVFVLKNKKDDKKDKDDKTTGTVTTDGTATEEIITEEATTEEVSGEIYYELVNIDDGTGKDSTDVLEELNNQGLYNFMVLNYNDHTGYIVIACDMFGSEFTFDDTSITMDGEKSEMVFDGDNPNITIGEEVLMFERITPEEFAVMYEAYSNVIYYDRGAVIPEDTVVPYEKVNVTIPAGYQTLGYINTKSYIDNIYVQYIDPNAGCVASFLIEEYGYWDLNENTIEYYADKEGFEWADTNVQLDNGLVLNYVYKEVSDHQYMPNGMVAYGEEEAKYCNGIMYICFMECDGKVYYISLYLDSDFYGDETENVAMKLFNGITPR